MMNLALIGKGKWKHFRKKSKKYIVKTFSSRDNLKKNFEKFEFIIIAT